MGECQARQFTNEHGNAIGAIAIYRDVTRNKRAEQALRAAEKRYSLLFEKNLAGVLRTTVDGHVLECNEAFARMLDYSSSKELAAINAQAFYQHPADRMTLLARLREQGTITQQEVCFQRKDGGPVWLLTNMNLVDSDEEPGAFTVIGTTFDISDRKRSREELRESQERFAAFMRHLRGGAFMKTAGENMSTTMRPPKGCFTSRPAISWERPITMFGHRNTQIASSPTMRKSSVPRCR